MAEENIKKHLSPEYTVIEEWNGTALSELTKTATITITRDSVKKSASRFNHFSRRFLDAFVPEGFPSSVTPDYIPFQIWDLLQGLSTYVRTMLSTQALLSAIGVGEKSATVIGATFQWFLRDLTGMLGGVLFTFYQGANLDSNAKMWRLVADLMNDIGMLMDLVSPLFPSAFLFIVCLGSLSRSFTGVASGATRAALTQHFALQDNAADISAKEGSQETVATMLGMAIGMFLAHITLGHSLAIWFCFLSLTIFHMYANYKAVRCLSLTTLNCERSSILLLHFMETGQVLTPKQVSTMEHVLPLWMTSWSTNRVKVLYQQIRIGIQISSINCQEMLDLSHLAGSYYNTAKYILLEKKGIISIVMHKDSAAADVLQAFMHALVMSELVDKDSSVHLESQSWMAKYYEVFVLELQSSGWKTERLLSPSVVWKANWFSRSEKLD
ncbi:protein root UVB sensitive 3-like isoform X1 [Olea europaea var. sylvestris]|uniref:Root UVB sensitive 3 n=1 Tax=Olea europaea subsp. europaea TaxID=158383 RepID=A0A8S0PQA9_OLEEU|nr:protein root UVB sensitive 3-like isoform X1 [Olea europaea var. sylvestris]CAA2955601.1 root UVB sensitive 3 [Olea europaea subsp. europaea]